MVRQWCDCCVFGCPFPVPTVCVRVCPFPCCHTPFCLVCTFPLFVVSRSTTLSQSFTIEDVRKQLALLGFADVPDHVVHSFVEKLYQQTQQQTAPPLPPPTAPRFGGKSVPLSPVIEEREDLLSPAPAPPRRGPTVPLGSGSKQGTALFAAAPTQAARSQFPATHKPVAVVRDVPVQHDENDGDYYDDDDDSEDDQVEDHDGQDADDDEDDDEEQENARPNSELVCAPKLPCPHRMLSSKRVPDRASLCLGLLVFGLQFCAKFVESMNRPITRNAT
jgi:hypothetical protein